jgi:hypothetical protein
VSPAATAPDLLALLRDTDPMRAAQAAGAGPGAVVTWTRAPAPADWLVDEESEGAVDAHRDAHRDGRRSEAVVRYGAGVAHEDVAARLEALGALSAETGLLMAVRPVPAEGDARRPGSWGYEDLLVIAAARLAAPDVPWIRPDWRRLGPAACQLAVAFGATDWRIPEGDRTDPEWLASAVGAEARERTP